MSYDIVFDLDGTLVDSVPVCASIVNAMLVDRGGAARVSWAEMREQISIGGARMIAALMGEHCGDSGRAIAEFRERYLRIDTPASCLFPGVREGIEQLAGWGYRLSICSSKPQNLCEKVLYDLGLTDRFAVIVGSQPNRPAKPDPALYADLLARIGGDRARSCLVGDSALDHALADRAGVAFILAAYGYTEADFQPPDDVWVADRFDRVPSLVETLVSEAEASPRVAGRWLVTRTVGMRQHRPSADI